MTYEQKAKQRILALVEENENGCWIWQGATGGGRERKDRYPSMHYKQKTARATRVMYELTYGEIPKGMLVCHSCDTPLCVNPDHLFLGNQKRNMRDAAAKGRIKIPGLKGGDHANAKTTDDQVVDFRKQYQAGRTASSIMRETGLAKETIKGMLAGRSYSHLPVFKREDSYMNNRKP